MGGQRSVSYVSCYSIPGMLPGTIPCVTLSQSACCPPTSPICSLICLYRATKKMAFYSYQGLYHPRGISYPFCSGHCCFATESEVMLFGRIRVAQYHPTQNPGTVIAVKLVLFMLQEKKYFRLFFYRTVLDVFFFIHK